MNLTQNRKLWNSGRLVNLIAWLISAGKKKEEKKTKVIKKGSDIGRSIGIN